MHYLNFYRGQDLMKAGLGPLRRIVIGSLQLSLLGLCGLAAEIPLPTRPNIVVILADDLGYSDIRCYAGEIPPPNLDRLAKEGIRFTQFYNTSRCCPSRASLLTGLYQH